MKTILYLRKVGLDAVFAKSEQKGSRALLSSLCLEVFFFFFFLPHFVATFSYAQCNRT